MVFRVDVVSDVLDRAVAVLNLEEQLGVGDQGHGHLQREDDLGVGLEVLVGLGGWSREVDEGVGVDRGRLLDPSVVLELL